MNYKKMILTCVLWTLTVLIVLSAILGCVMFFAFPKNLGDFFYNLGSDGIASSLYMRVYEKDHDIYYCYKSLNIEISKGNNARIIKLYDAFVSDENMEDFMSQLKTRNENLNIGVLEKSAILNEEDYLKNRYIKALINTNEVGKAYSVALDAFKSYKTFDLRNQGVYAIYQFINIDGYNDFNSSPAGYTSNLITSIKEYFDLSIETFNNSKTFSTNLDKAYLISLGNRIIQVGQNINKICNDEEITASNNVKMENINNYIKEIL